MITPSPLAHHTTPIGKIIMLELLDILKPHATIISALSAFVSAIAVLVSTGFVIWTTCFRKTRRDRIDELKTEMRVYVSNNHGFDLYPQDAHTMLENLSKSEKYGKDEYKDLYRPALHELMADNKLEFKFHLDNRHKGAE